MHQKRFLRMQAAMAQVKAEGMGTRIEWVGAKIKRCPEQAIFFLQDLKQKTFGTQGKVLGAP